jgi:uncharacterized protein YkwD
MLEPGMQKAPFRWAILVALMAAAPSRTVADAPRFEDVVLAQINFAREHPEDYARQLQSLTPDDAQAATADEPDALPEAIAFLDRQRPLKPLHPDPRLAAAAMDHVVAQGPSGAVGHGQFSQRLQARLLGAGLAGEDIDYGEHTPDQVVRRLIVDAGVPNRGHRSNIFGRGFELSGVSCGPHRVYGAMCVIDFAGAMVARDQ